MKLRINPRVADDLKEIRDHIAEDNEETAEKTVYEIYKSLENIQQFPNIGASLPKRVSFKTDYKYLAHENYIVLYRIRQDFVEIYRVIDRYQDITGILFQ